MAKEKTKPGMMLYFEDYVALRESLSNDELVSVFDALIAYAETGEIPNLQSLSSGAMICWRLLRSKIDRDNAHYEEVKEQRKKAANERVKKAKETEEMLQKLQMQQMQQMQPTASSSVSSSASEAEAGEVTAGNSAAPSREEVRIYFRKKGYAKDPSSFFDWYESVGWMRSKDLPITNWKSAADRWERNDYD